jgi:hypothetical protein
MTGPLRYNKTLLENEIGELFETINDLEYVSTYEQLDLKIKLKMLECLNEIASKMGEKK